MKIVLFDIDGTLMDSGGAGTRAVESAICDVLNRSCSEIGRSRVSMAGKTDPQILKEILSMLSVTYDRGIIDRILARYLENLQVEIRGNGKQLKPSVIETLDWLEGMNNVHLGLLTGNMEDGARIKLSSFGIWERFSFGAYGSDNEDRNKLLPEAIKRFRTLTGDEVAFSDCIVIGDTPRDVECSKPHGARALAVATGPYSMEALLNTDADAVIDNLGDVREALSPLLSA